MKYIVKKLLMLAFSTIVFQCFSQNYNRFYEQGDIAYKKKNYYQAAKLFEESHSMIPDVSAITYRLAESLFFAHNYEQALVYFTEVITKSPGKYPMAYFYQAELQKLLKQYSDAMSSYKYYNHFFTENPEYNIKSSKQILSCDFAIKNNTVSPISIKKLTAPINTLFSEISIAEYNDSVLIYSAMSPNKDSSEYVAKMFFNKHIYAFESLVLSINDIGLNVIDLTLSNDKKTAFFCACVDTIGSTDFKIYCTVFDSMKWKKPELCPEQINLDGYRSTQPYFTRIKGNDYLFFVSDRPGGQGNLDIWYSQRLYNRFLKPVNLGTTINTIGDDVTPFYDTVSNQLYFSSELHKGYGGFDIFSTTGFPKDWSQPVNLGLPINSSFNDVYFTISENKKHRYFTSDREPVQIDGQNYYINDFYCFNTQADSANDMIEKIPLSTSIAVSKTVNLKTAEGNATTKGTLDVKPQIFNLYFDHNQPEIDSKDGYEMLLNAYLKNPESQTKELKELNIDKALIDFSKMLRNLIQTIRADSKIEIQLKAFTSPTGNQSYNTELAKRRINTIMELLQKSESGKPNAYLNKNITITILPPEIPVSLNIANSEALQMASQRKVEIIILRK